MEKKIPQNYFLPWMWRRCRASVRQVRLVIPSVRAGGGGCTNSTERRLRRGAPGSLMCPHLEVSEAHHAASVMETKGRQPRNQPDTHRQRSEHFLLKGTVTFSPSRVHGLDPAPYSAVRRGGFRCSTEQHHKQRQLERHLAAASSSAT